MYCLLYLYFVLFACLLSSRADWLSKNYILFHSSVLIFIHPYCCYLTLIYLQHSQQSFLEELERTVALLAFEDISNCPVGDLLHMNQRVKTASEVNAAILTSQSHEKGKHPFHKF